MMTDVRVKKYPIEAKGPYTVYVRSKDTPIDPLALQKSIFSAYKSCEEVFLVNDSKIRFKFKDLSEANGLVEDERYKRYNVYVPAKEVEVQGVVQLPADTEIEPLQSAVGKFKDPRMGTVRIVEVFRLLKPNTDVRTNQVKVTFAGSCLPDYVVVQDALLLRTRPYVPKVFFCKKCLDYGHTENYCTRFKKKCLKCSGEHAESTCGVETPICRHCRGQHLTGSDDCPTTKRAKLRNRDRQFLYVQNQYSILLTEAQDRTQAEQDSPVEAMDEDESSFPPLTPRRKRQRSPVTPPQSTKRAFASVVASGSTGRAESAPVPSPRNGREKSLPASGGATSRKMSSGSSRVTGSSVGGMSVVFRILDVLFAHFKVPDQLRVVIVEFLTPIVRNVWSQFSSSLIGGLSQSFVNA
jgi:hypothetical protein